MEGAGDNFFTYEIRNVPPPPTELQSTGNKNIYISIAALVVAATIYLCCLYCFRRLMRKCCCYEEDRDNNVTYSHSTVPGDSPYENVYDVVQGERGRDININITEPIPIPLPSSHSANNMHNIHYSSNK